MPLLACSTLRPEEKSVYRNAALTNPDPAPAALSPPRDIEGAGQPVLDEFYMRTQADFHFAKGEALSLEGDPEGAANEFRLTTVYDSTSASVRKRLAEEYLRQGLLSEAIEQAELASQLAPEDVGVLLLLGQIYAGMKLTEKARGAYQRAADLDPSSLEAVLALAAVYIEENSYAEAEKVLIKASGQKDLKDAYLVFLYLGGLYLEPEGRKEWAKAEAAFQKGRRLKPDSEELALSLASVYEQTRRPEKALQIMEVFQSQHGPARNAAVFLGQKYIEKEEYEKALQQLEIQEGFEPENLNIKIRMALILVERKSYPQAIQKLEEVLFLAPDSDKIRFYLGAVYEEIKSLDRARTHYAEIGASSQYYVDAVLRSAAILKAEGAVEAALRLIAQAANSRQDVPQFVAFQAALLDELKRYEEAQKALELALARFPNDTQLRFFLGSTLDRLGRKDASIAEMRRVLEMDADHVQALNYLAYTFAEMGRDLEEAEIMARRALVLRPDDAYILDTVGWVLYKQDRIAEAITYLEAANSKNPDESIIIEHLGDAYFRFQLHSKARAMYQRALDAETDDSRLKEIQRKISSIDQRRSIERIPANVNSQERGF